MKTLLIKKSKPVSFSVKNKGNEEDIRCRAEEIWRENNCPEGLHLSHWQQAEEELRGGKVNSLNSLPIIL